MYNTTLNNYLEYKEEHLMKLLDLQIESLNKILKIGDNLLKNINVDLGDDLTFIMLRSIFPYVFINKTLDTKNYQIYSYISDYLNIRPFSDDQMKNNTTDIHDLAFELFIDFKKIIELFYDMDITELKKSFLDFLIIIAILDTENLEIRVDFINEHLFNVFDMSKINLPVNFVEDNNSELIKNSPLAYFSEESVLNKAIKMNIYPDVDCFGAILFDRMSDTHLIDIRDETLIISENTSIYTRKYIVSEINGETDISNIVFPQYYNDPRASDAIKEIGPFYIKDIREVLPLHISENESLKKLFFKNIGESGLNLDLTINSPYNTNFSDIKVCIRDISTHVIENRNAYLITLDIDFSEVILEGKFLNFNIDSIFDHYPEKNYFDVLKGFSIKRSEFVPLLVDSLNLYDIINDVGVSGNPLLFNSAVVKNLDSFYNLIKLGAHFDYTFGKSKEEKINNSTLIDALYLNNYYPIYYLTLFSDADFHSIIKNAPLFKIKDPNMPFKYQSKEHTDLITKFIHSLSKLDQ